jgi:POT family proton-dependent oligopeptide transporter
MSNTLSNSIVGLFLSFNYILQLLGGLIGGRFLSNRTLFCITIFVQSAGLYFLAAADQAVLYAGLSLYLVGCGLNTTCYNALLTQRFKSEDDRRETAFFLSYAAMNVGFFAGYISSGFFDFSNEYQYLFYACIMTNIITLLLLTKSWGNLTDGDTPLMQVKNQNQFMVKNSIGLTLVILLIPTMLLCLHSDKFSKGVVFALSFIMFGYILILGLKQKSIADKKKIRAYLILAMSSILFLVI